MATPEILEALDPTYEKVFTEEPYIMEESGLCVVEFCPNPHDDNCWYFAGCGVQWLVCREHLDLWNDYDYYGWLLRMDK